MMFDLQVATDSSYGKFNMLCGTRNDLVASFTNVQSNITENAAVLVAGAGSTLEACAVGAQYSTDLCSVVNATVNACTAPFHSPVPVLQISGGEPLLDSTTGNSVVTSGHITKPTT